MVDMKRVYGSTLLEMCERQPLDKITVMSLTAEAGTARQTFYNNFRDIDDLINYIPISYLINDGIPVNALENVRRALCFAQAHKGFFSQLPHHGGQSNFRDTVLNWLRDMCYREHVDPSLPEEEQCLMRVKIDIYLFGIVDVILQWFANGLDLPLDMLLGAIWDCSPAFLRSTPLHPEKSE